MSEIELKPCAHCGGRASLESFDNGFGETAYTVECVLCGVGSKAYLGAERTLAEWNTRTNGWIGVDDRLPEKYVDCLIWPRPDYGTDCYVGQYNGYGWQCFEYECNFGIVSNNVTVTHWMPLPEPPK